MLISCNKKETSATAVVENAVPVAETAVNINVAPVEELEKLPNVGAKLARKIVEHRERYGRFRRPEHLIMVPGVSDERYRGMRHLIKTE